jgi:hypothetical protein
MSDRIGLVAIEHTLGKMHKDLSEIAAEQEKLNIRLRLMSEHLISIAGSLSLWFDELKQKDESRTMLDTKD